MDRNDQLRLELDRTVKAFRTLEYSPTAQCFYDGFGDAVVWRDEIPGEAQFDCLSFLRHIHHVRMEAARNHAVPSDPVWQYFQRQVPQWPGFRPERCEAEHLLAAYSRLRPLKGR